MSSLIAFQPSSAVIQKIQARNSRNVRESPVAIVCVQRISFVAAPAVIRPDELVNRIPTELGCHPENPSQKFQKCQRKSRRHCLRTAYFVRSRSSCDPTG